MWAVAIHSEEMLKRIAQALRAELALEWITTGTGAQVAVASKESGGPHFFVTPEDPAQIHHAISWVHKNLQPSAVISSDIAELCDLNDPQKIKSFVPTSCLRSAGRNDFGGGPILFEEIFFNGDLQRQLLKAASETELSNSNKLFGTTRAIKKSEERDWIFKNLGCQAYDPFTSQLLISGKRWGVPIGCIKTLAAEGIADRDVFDSFVSSWRRLRSLL